MGEKRALIVVDMQNDYLWERRLPKFNYNTPALLAAVNQAIDYYRSMYYDVFYIAEVIPNNFITKKTLGFSLAGTPGAMLHPGLSIVSDNYYEKQMPDSFTNAAFKRRMQHEYYMEAVICGLDFCGCAGATAKGARGCGMKSTLLLNATGCRYGEDKYQKMYASLLGMGVQLL